MKCQNIQETNSYLLFSQNSQTPERKRGREKSAERLNMTDDVHQRCVCMCVCVCARARARARAFVRACLCVWVGVGVHLVYWICVGFCFFGLFVLIRLFAL